MDRVAVRRQAKKTLGRYFSHGEVPGRLYVFYAHVYERKDLRVSLVVFLVLIGLERLDWPPEYVEVYLVEVGEHLQTFLKGRSYSWVGAEMNPLLITNSVRYHSLFIGHPKKTVNRQMRFNAKS
ncbi:MAG: hypothetical protein ACE5I5_12515 [Candidatus Heimdallarchaeota archaeon]